MGEQARKEPERPPAHRRHRVTVAFDDVEWARVVRAAGVSGQLPGTWIGAIAARVAAGERTVLPADWQATVRALTSMRREQVELRRELERARAITERYAAALGSTASPEVARHLEAMTTLLDRLAWQAWALEGIIAQARHHTD
jgi:hypothetical protein